MKTKTKYYVVWVGLRTGVFTTWEEVKPLIHGFANAKYKSFLTKEEAQIAFKAGPKLTTTFKKNPNIYNQQSKEKIIAQAICVDAACSGNPGPMEYRAVDNITKNEVFRIGPLDDGTNNIGEYLAIVHALAYLSKNKDDATVIYTDSVNAIKWVNEKKHRSKLTKTHKNIKIFELLDRADRWLQNSTWRNKILKWDTKNWGEIPADFGRK